MLAYVILELLQECHHDVREYQPRGKCYKTFYPYFTNVQSVCPWQAFPAWSNVCG
jgi:hypothetical protein